MKCISVRQPWAWLITRPDLLGDQRTSALANGQLKTIENRTWRTHHRGPVLIHAAKGMAIPEYERVQGLLFEPGGPGVTLPDPAVLQRGGLVGMGSLTGCIEPQDRSSWWHMPGCFGFELSSVHPVEFIPLKGQLMLFDVGNDVVSGMANIVHSQPTKHA